MNNCSNVELRQWNGIKYKFSQVRRKIAKAGIILAICICSSGSVIYAGETDKAEETAAPELHQLLPEAGSELGDQEYGPYYFHNKLDNVNSEYYIIHDYYNMVSENGLHIISNYETYQQTSKYSCGPVAVLMALNHFGVNDYNESEICLLTGSNPDTGTSLEGLLEFLTDLDFRVDYHAGTETRFSNMRETEEYLIYAIDQNAPVIVLWQDWYGHWTTIIGVDTCGTNNIFDDVLILADSYDITDHYQDGYYQVSLAHFFCMWRETVGTGKAELYEQPFIAVYGRSEE